MALLELFTQVPGWHLTFVVAKQSPDSVHPARLLHQP